jgi:hypothetical protein
MRPIASALHQSHRTGDLEAASALCHNQAIEASNLVWHKERGSTCLLGTSALSNDRKGRSALPDLEIDIYAQENVPRDDPTLTYIIHNLV